MKEIEISAGENIARACEQLAKEAPAFMVFNDTRVEAAAGDSPDVLYGRWWTQRQLGEDVERAAQRRADDRKALKLVALNNLAEEAWSFLGYARAAVTGLDPEYEAKYEASMKALEMAIVEWRIL